MRATSNQKTSVSFVFRFIWLSLFTVASLAMPALAVATPKGGQVREQKQQSQTTVRGRLVRKTGGRVRSAAYVALTLSLPNTVRRSVPVYTDTQGIYYIDVPPGRYVLEIWGPKKEIIKSYNITVPATQTFDVAPITIP
jgi:hypothetical protein